MAVIGGGIEIRYKTAKQESAGFRTISIRKIHSFAETELLSCLTILFYCLAVPSVDVCRWHSLWIHLTMPNYCQREISQMLFTYTFIEINFNFKFYWKCGCVDFQSLNPFTKSHVLFIFLRDRWPRFFLPSLDTTDPICSLFASAFILAMLSRKRSVSDWKIRTPWNNLPPGWKLLQETQDLTDISKNTGKLFVFKIWAN